MWQDDASSPQGERLLPGSLSLQWEPEEAGAAAPAPPTPSSATCLAPLRAARCTLPALLLLHLLTIGPLIFYHAGFAAQLATPGLQAATCAATLADGPCAQAGRAPCDVLCPPRCSDLWVQDAHAYAVYGGSGPAPAYRSDSKLCRAALHAGLLQDARGGCVRAHLGGSSPPRYPAPALPQHGVQALPAPYLPGPSLTFSASRAPHCPGSLQWPWLAVAAALALASHALLPPAAAFFLTCASVFLYLTFTARGGEPLALLLAGAGAGVSAGALLYASWRCAARQALEQRGLGLPRVAACHLLPLLLMAHMNLLTPLVPDFSFTASSLGSLTPGGIAVVAALCLAIAAGVAYQARLLWRSGGGGALGAGYAAGALCLGALSLLLQGRAAVHVHHSLLALALLPLTRTPSLPTLAAQGLLLGMLLNGLAFWGVAGPWDAVPSMGGLPAAPNCSAGAGLAGKGSVAVSWAGCETLPGAMWALTGNGGLLQVGVQQAFALALPLGANVSFALQLLFMDGTFSLPSQAITVYVDR